VTISVVIPLFNTERYIRAAVDSVLQQSVLPSEIVVVDDGSTDTGPSLVEQYGGMVRLDRQPKRGIGATRNRGIELAQGDVLAFLDADDLWLPDKLERQLEVLARPNADIVFGRVEQFWSPELPAGPAPTETGTGPLVGAMLIRRETFQRVGPFATGMLVAGFLDWYGRAVDLGLRIVHHPEVALRRRLHDANTGRQQRQARADYARVLKQMIDRRRGRRPGETA
jgi:glycosyltransferase involved in cell wall biosynthesis